MFLRFYSVRLLFLLLVAVAPLAPVRAQQTPPPAAEARRLMPAANFVGDLEHWQYDTFRVKWRESVSYPFPRGFVTFSLNARGQVDEMKIDVPNPDFDFTELEFKRRADAVTATGNQ